MQTIGLFVFEQELTSAGAAWWTLVPVGAGPLEPGRHIKTLLSEDQRARYPHGTILVPTFSNFKSTMLEYNYNRFTP